MSTTRAKCESGALQSPLRVLLILCPFKVGGPKS
jgi:hypothetical protein